jgi:periplasmic copper chaperone A
MSHSVAERASVPVPTFVLPCSVQRGLYVRWGWEYITTMNTGPYPRFLAASLLALSLAHASAAEFRTGSIEVDNPWLRATPRGTSVAGGYMKISNKGSLPDRLIGGSTAVAGRFEVHQMLMDQGVAKMRPIEGGLEIKPGDTVELKPGSLHVMFMDLKQPLEKGQKIKGTLEFEKAGKIDIEYTVEAVGASSPSGAH